MHTIEASILVPFGLGIIVITIMLTFYLHDQTVLEAEQASTVLEWQMSIGEWEEMICEEEAKQWEEYLLIGQVSPIKMKAGSMTFSLKTRETYRLFDSVLGMMDQNLPKEEENGLRIWLKINPFWLKRIWKVVEQK